MAEPTVRVRVLGELGVDTDGRVRRGAELGSRKGRLVLARLAAQPDVSRTTDALAELLWRAARPTRPGPRWPLS